MARWLRTFFILSIVAILNIVGFMYMSGYSFIIWGTPVDQQPVNSKVRIDKLFQQGDVAGILRHPDVRKDESGNAVPQDRIDYNNSRDFIFTGGQNRSSQFPVLDTNKGNDQNLLLQRNKVDVPNNLDNDLPDESRNRNVVVVKIQQPEQQLVNQQEPSNAINPQLPVNPNPNQQAAGQIHPDLANQLEKIKSEMAAHEQNFHQNLQPQGSLQQQQQQQQQQQLPQQVLNPNIQIGPDEQNVNPAVASQFGPQPDPRVRHIDAAVLKGIVSKAKPPNQEKIFPHNFNVVINEPTTCENADGSTKDVFLLVLINSIHKNFEQRRAIRATWGSIKEVDGKPVVTLFTLAKNNDKKLNEVVQKESEQHHDLLMEDFVDTYKNLTLKTIMGLKWAATYCPKANFVMKTDDDMYINYESLVRHLKSSSTPTQNYVAGFVINGSPIRDPKSKWYMPRDLYPGNKYPPFCSGTGYVMSGDVAMKVYAISEYTAFLYLEDVYVAICLEKLGIVPIKHREFNNWRTAYSYCRFKRIISTHMVTPTEMNRIWKDQHSKKSYKC